MLISTCFYRSWRLSKIILLPHKRQNNKFLVLGARSFVPLNRPSTAPDTKRWLEVAVRLFLPLAFQKCFLPSIQHGCPPLDPEQWLGRAAGSECSRSPLGHDGFESQATAQQDDLRLTGSGMLLTYQKLKQCLTRPCANAVHLQKTQDGFL